MIRVFKNICLALILIIILTSPHIYNILVSAPSWAKPGIYFTYSIVGRLYASPPLEDGTENYVVVGHGQFFGLKVNESGIMGYYELIDLNDTKNYFTRILGMPGYRINSFINWSTEYSSHKFNIYVDPRTIPLDPKIYENITTQENYVYYTRIKSVYDKNTGVLLEYYYFTEANDTVDNKRYVYELHYKLIDTNVEELFGLIGKLENHVSTTRTTAYVTTGTSNAIETNMQETSNYPINYVAYLVLFVLVGASIYYIFGKKK